MSTKSAFFGGRMLAALAAAAMAMPASAQLATAADADGEYVRGRVLVVPRAGLAEAEVGRIVGAHGGKAKAIGKSRVFIVDLPAQASETAIAGLLARHPHLKSAELDRRVPAALAVNDPYIGAQWHTTRIGAPSAWEVTMGGPVTIAVLDTGVDAGHPDLSVRLVAGWNFYDNNANTADVHGHGTAVAGAAAATANNGTGVAGVAGQAKIMPLRVSDPTGYAYWSTVAQAITFAVDNGARVANISYVGLMSSSSILSASQYMKSKGGLVVVAAGNNAKDEGYGPTTHLIPVSATTGSDTLAGFSSYGNFVAIAAPGEGIWTTTRGGGYGSWQGTSFASPVVAGTVALMMAAQPGLSSTEVESLLFSTAVDLGTAGRDRYFGHGRVNAEAAVLAAAGAKMTSDTTAPVASISAPLGGSMVSGLVPVDVAASDNTGATKVELRVNGAVHATDTSSPFAFSWDSTRVANGSATLQAIAYDATGNKGTSATVTVQVSNSGSVGAGPILTGSSTNQGSTWSAIVKVAGAAAGTLITGTWNIGGTPSSCTTDNTGSCLITRTRIAKSVGSATWTHGATGSKVTIGKP